MAKTSKQIAQKLHRTFVPHHTNNYRPHIITHYGLALVLAFLLTFQFFYNLSTTGKVQVLGYATNVSNSGLLEHTNKNRAESGLKKLTINEKLNQAAEAKAEHMIANNYWSHYAPDGTTPWNFVNKTGYEYLKAGENLAYGFTDSYGTVQGWMNSKPHADNILDPLYTEVGFGMANGSSFQGDENTVIVAMYAQPTVAAVETTQPEEEATEVTAPTWTPQDTIRDEETTVPIVSAPVKKISVFEAIISGDAHWGMYVTIITLTAVAGAYVVRHTIAIRQLANHGEHFMDGHPMLEAALIYVLLWLVLAATYGAVL